MKKKKNGVFPGEHVTVMESKKVKDCNFAPAARRTRWQAWQRQMDPYKYDLRRGQPLMAEKGKV